MLSTKIARHSDFAVRELIIIAVLLVFEGIALHTIVSFDPLGRMTY